MQRASDTCKHTCMHAYGGVMVVFAQGGRSARAT